ncbi:hypothetical protein F5Y17DRAFT_84805 [Xylariaceae sp. FL0594]|nr:hypothetical protein F5Y17DRAFT_84805 [Xylariaceae sp. FL0594]
MAGVSFPSAAQKEQPPRPGENLNVTLLEFASKHMEDELERLARECDQRLEGDLIPKLLALLRQIDQEREVFEQHRSEAARALSNTFSLLPVDPIAVNDAIGRLRDVTPRLLTLLPTVSSLALSSAVTTSSPPENGNAKEEGVTRPKTPASPDQALQNQGKATSSAGTKRKPESGHVSLRRRSPSERDSRLKRRMRANDKRKETRAFSPKRVAFPNLIPEESIFRHKEREGYFVIRCTLCNSGHFTDPPFLDNRALEHFQKHSADGLIPEGLTNDLIFEEYAHQVDGVGMASKYWIKEHVGDTTHTFSPTKQTSGDHPPEHDGDDIPEANKSHRARSPLNSPVWKPSPGDQFDCEAEEASPARRGLRNRPRPDYAEIVANKDPWDRPESVGQEETPFTTINVVRPTTSAKRRLKKPTAGLGTATTESKPFGYKGDPWPRRSAPR